MKIQQQGYQAGRCRGLWQFCKQLSIRNIVLDVHSVAGSGNTAGGMTLSWVLRRLQETVTSRDYCNMALGAQRRESFSEEMACLQRPGQGGKVMCRWEVGQGPPGRGDRRARNPRAGRAAHSGNAAHREVLGGKAGDGSPSAPGLRTRAGDKRCFSIIKAPTCTRAEQNQPFRGERSPFSSSAFLFFPSSRLLPAQIVPLLKEGIQAPAFHCFQTRVFNVRRFLTGITFGK